MGSTLLDAMKDCAKKGTVCSRMECIELFLDSLNEITGGKLKDQLKHYTTLKTLWCLRPSAKDVDDKWCKAQYDIIKPLCESCGSCPKSKKLIVWSDCDKYRDSALCAAACSQYFKHFDTVLCSKYSKKARDKDPKIGPNDRDPNRHREKIEDFNKQSQRCLERFAECERREDA